jgi:hypothetical protein
MSAWQMCVTITITCNGWGAGKKKERETKLGMHTSKKDNFPEWYGLVLWRRVLDEHTNC